MIALSILDIKKTMHTLLKTPTFDSFFVQEIQITKDVSLFLDGHIHAEFFSFDEKSDETIKTQNEYATYQSMRSLVAGFIFGPNPPLSFKFVLHAPDSYRKNLTNHVAFTADPDIIKALILTFRYEHGKLTCLTGCAYSTFTTDKSMEALWDKAICKSFDKIETAYEIL